MPGIDDPEVQLLASIAGALQGDYVTGGADPWLGSPFEWIKKTPSSRRRGKIGEQLVAGWSAAKGLDVIASPDSQADRIIHGYRIEVKFSTMWETGIYKFQQVRDQNYDYAFCLGVAPFDAHAWLLPKSLLLDHVIGHLGQHTGAAASDTAWFGFPPGEPLVWLSGHGGRLGDVWTTLSKLSRGPL